VTAVIVDAGSAAREPISPVIEDLASARVAVTRFPTHLATADVHEPFSVFTT
jgi:hypothetical protein